MSKFTPNTKTYRPLHSGGGYPDGSTTKILWSINNPNASLALEITGKKLSAGHETFHQTFPMASSPLGDYPSIVNVPTPGCWQVQLPSLFGSLETDVPRNAQRDRSKAHLFRLHSPKGQFDLNTRIGGKIDAFAGVRNFLVVGTALRSGLIHGGFSAAYSGVRSKKRAKQRSDFQSERRK